MYSSSRSTSRRFLCTVLLVLACAFPLMTSALQAQNVLTFSSVSHNFGQGPLNAPIEFGMKVTNSSSTTNYLNFQVNISGSSEFTSATNCPASLAPAAVCEVIFTFTPTALGTVQATWNLTGTGDSTFSYSPALPGTLTGDGVIAAGLTVSTSGHNFGTEFKNYTSAPYGVVLTNASLDPIELDIAAGSTQFPLYLPSDNCPATLGPNQSCNIVWSFDPSAGTKNNQPTPYTFLNTISGVDQKTNQPVILTNGGGTQVSGVTLVGFGITGPSNYVGLSTSIHYFGEWNTGTASNLYSVQVINTEATPVSLTYTPPPSPNYFPIRYENCFPNGYYTATLAGGASCQVQFYYQPGGSTFGKQTALYGLSATLIKTGASVTVLDMTTSNSVAGVNLSGTMVSGYLSSTYASNDFGAFVTGNTNTTQTFTDTIKNTGCVSVSPGCPVVGDSYTVTFANANTNYKSFPIQTGSGACKKLTGYPVVTLAPQASCTLIYEFSPQISGEIVNNFGISAIDATTMQPIPVLSGGTQITGLNLTGYGTANAGLFLLTATYNFGEQGIGGSSAAYTTYLYNSTGTVIALSYAYSNPESQDFTLGTGAVGNISACGPTLGEFATCALSWTFTPEQVGTLSVVYDITATTGGSPVTITNLANNQPVAGVTLQGTGVN